MPIILEAQEFCKPGGVIDNKRRSQLVQLDALHMQLLCLDLTKSNSAAQKLKMLYQESMSLLEGSIVPPRMLGVIHLVIRVEYQNTEMYDEQNGGKMYMHGKDWKQAFNSFMEGFRNFNQVVSCLTNA